MVDESNYDFKVTAAGRVNIIGEHIDYCGGKVFPAALSMRNTVYVRPNGTNRINISWTTLPDKVSLDTDRLEEYRGLKYGNYQAGSALMWAKAGHKITGCDMVQHCSVPFGSGLSSSAAIEVSTIAALAAVAGERIDAVRIALAAQRAEREYVGMNCGIMDQYASACGRAGYAMLLDCATLGCEYVPLKMGDYSLVIINCNKPHNLVESKYNERREETDRALKIIRGYIHIDKLADLTEEQFTEVAPRLSGVLRARVRHVVEECARVNLAASAMKAGDMPALGNLLNQSHMSLRDLYEVTGFELDTLTEIARSHPACVGSRMTGGGFGGCTVSIVETSRAEEFKEYVAENYKKRTGYNAECYSSEAADGITVDKL